jgi:hypothetical protein
MPWLPLEGPKSPDTAQPLDKKNRFFVDESLGVEAANWLRSRGYNAVFAADVGLLGHSDEDTAGQQFVFWFLPKQNSRRRKD